MVAFFFLFWVQDSQRQIRMRIYRIISVDKAYVNLKAKFLNTLPSNLLNSPSRWHGLLIKHYNFSEPAHFLCAVPSLDHSSTNLTYKRDGM